MTFLQGNVQSLNDIIVLRVEVIALFIFELMLIKTIMIEYMAFLGISL